MVTSVQKRPRSCCCTPLHRIPIQIVWHAFLLIAFIVHVLHTCVMFCPVQLLHVSLFCVFYCCSNGSVNIRPWDNSRKLAFWPTLSTFPVRLIMCTDSLFDQGQCTKNINLIHVIEGFSKLHPPIIPGQVGRIIGSCQYHVSSVFWFVLFCFSTWSEYTLSPEKVTQDCDKFTALLKCT